MKKSTYIWIAAIVLIVVLSYAFKKPLFGVVWDLPTESRIMDLAPPIRDMAREFIHKAEKQGIKLKIPKGDGFRSMEDQAAIYAKGRTAPGTIVSNAQPGESYHNYGLAFDVYEMKNGSAILANPNSDKIGAIGKSVGLQWGGDWSTPDPSHFYRSMGYTTRELLTMHRAGKSFYT